MPVMPFIGHPVHDSLMLFARMVYPHNEAKRFRLFYNFFLSWWAAQKEHADSIEIPKEDMQNALKYALTPIPTKDLRRTYDKGFLAGELLFFLMLMKNEGKVASPSIERAITLQMVNIATKEESLIKYKAQAAEIKDKNVSRRAGTPYTGGSYNSCWARWKEFKEVSPFWAASVFVNDMGLRGATDLDYPLCLLKGNGADLVMLIEFSKVFTAIAETHQDNRKRFLLKPGEAWIAPLEIDIYQKFSERYDFKKVVKSAHLRGIKSFLDEKHDYYDSKRSAAIDDLIKQRLSPGRYASRK